MAGADLLRVVHAQDDLVREPVRGKVRRRGEQEAKHQPARAAERLPDEHQQRAHRPQQQGRLHRVVHVTFQRSAFGSQPDS